jgi:ABC-type sugar transport system ATPase subunit
MSGSTASDPPLLAARGVHKRFPGVHALRGVDLDIRAGEVHAVVGENGAGKSTLMHILAGVYQPDAGRLEWEGRPVVFADERAAADAGIALVHQERSLFGPLSVAENVFAGRPPRTRWGTIDRRRLRAETERLLREVGLAADPDTPVERLSPARQQLVEVAKALSQDARVIIFDEPTAALSLTETETLFGIIAGLRRGGVGIAYISHRLAEVFRMADRVTVLKDGAGQGTGPVAEATPAGLVARMVGRDLDPHRRRAAPAPGPVVLEVRGLSDDPARAGLRPRLRDITFSARAGEVVALAGLVGAGRTETALALFGMRPGVTGDVTVDGRRVVARSPQDAIAAGIGYVPEDRKESGLFLDMSIADNVTSAAGDRFGRWRFDAAGRDRTVTDLCGRLRVVCRGPAEPARNLSGGNQQKVVLARWLLADPKVLIVDEPTRGVDVGAKAEIHALLFDVARRGAAVVVISSDLPEVLAVADRVLVMRDGRLAGELAGGTTTEEDVMRLATLG